MLSRSGFSWDSEKNMIQCEKQSYEEQCKNHSEAKGFFGVPFPPFEKLAAIYSKDIATGEGVEGFGEAVIRLESEIDLEAEVNSMDSHATDPATSSKRQRRDTRPRRETQISDPFLTMPGDVNNQLAFVAQNVGKMAMAMEREAIVQEKAMQEEPQQKFKEKAINELVRLGFTGSEIVTAATIFAKYSEQMHMMMALPET